MPEIGEQIAPGLIYYGKCQRCGCTQYNPAWIPVCGWCALRELQADQEWKRYRSPAVIDAAKQLFMAFDNKAIEQELLIDPYELRSLKKRVEHQSPTPFYLVAQ